MKNPWACCSAPHIGMKIIELRLKEKYDRLLKMPLGTKVTYGSGGVSARPSAGLRLKRLLPEVLWLAFRGSWTRWQTADTIPVDTGN